MDSTGIAAFVFELASDQRLGILVAVAEKPLRHAQIARQIDLTDSEATRHLTRLSSADLVTKTPRGEYAPTNLARLLLAAVPYLRFLVANRPFLLSHDLLGLPPEFVERLGALSECTFETGMYNVVDFQERSLRAAKRRIWVVSKQAFDVAIAIMREKAAKGADVRAIRDRGELERDKSAPERNYPIRLLDETRIFLAVLDDIAGVCFPSTDGTVDMATMAVVRDPRGYRWAEDLFGHLWGRARERL